MLLRSRLRDEIEAVIGRHEEPSIYGGPPGDPGLAGGPDSISWEVNGDVASVAAAGSAAIIMEVLHPSVMAGVEEHSSYRADPIRRAQTTFGYVVQTTFGSTTAATDVIERVKRIHGHVRGTRPDGVPYEALDPALIAWVHTCIPWAVMEAFQRHRRPLTIDERDRYLREQAPIGRMAGADHVPESMAELERYVEDVRPRLAMNEQTRSFVAFLAGDTGGDDATSAREQLQARLAIAASMSLMPTWARHLTGTHLPAPVLQLVALPLAHVQAAAVRWAVPELACKRMATERATGAAAEPFGVARASA
jgi:uncharacterized protein (DUF2236 family)